MPRSSTVPVSPVAPLVGLAHLVALWAFAVAQPVFDILRRHTEFFIAYRVTPVDLLAYTALVAFGFPLLVALPYLVLARLSPKAGWTLLVGLVGLLLAALASQLMAHRLPLPTAAHVLVAAMAGAGGAWAYKARAGVRGFATAAAAAAVLFPALFLLHPSMAAFLRTETRDLEAAGSFGTSAPPIVFLVFDQLPLTSLMNAEGGIDRGRYPGFGALADRSTWYRNATTVADLTGWALPPILSGIRPEPRRAPTVKSYPSNLFTWLGDRYRFEAVEPITQLCPERLCGSQREPLPARLALMTIDTAVVYLTLALPEGPRAYLPPLTENWRGFLDNQRWQRRWVAERDQDRRRPARDLIASIDRDDPQPTLYFAHTLLPHEPFVYLRSGQRFTSEPATVGLKTDGRWSADPWVVTQAYQRHLMQLELVDEFVRQLLARLDEQGLLDQALIVVTSDHGASFRPGLPFKGIQTATLPDLLPVPLFIKAPGQRTGVVSDRNMQSVDILPTIGDLLGSALTWKADGVSAMSATPAPAVKRFHYTGASKTLEVEAEAIARARDEAVRRKVGLFGEGGFPAAAPGHRDLLGRRLADFEIEDGDFLGVVDEPERLIDPRPDADEWPAMITGRVRDMGGRPIDAEIALALGGRIAAVSRTVRGSDGPVGRWWAMVSPDAVAAAGNDVQVLVVPADRSRPLGRAYASGDRPESLNLASQFAEEYFEVAQSGLYRRQGSPLPYRWTNGEATLDVPMTDPPPRSLRVGILHVRPGGTPMKVAINGCTLFDGRVEEAPWHRTFALRDCPAAALAGRTARIVVSSPPWTEEGGEARTLGVAVEAVNLFEADWPPPEAGQDAESRASLRSVEQTSGTFAAGGTVRLELANLGETTWLPLRDAPAPDRAVHLAIRWRAARGRTREQQLQLPHAMYPKDKVLIEAPLVPPPDLPAPGPWEVTIVPVEHDGTPLSADARVVVSVAAPQPGN